MPTDVNVTEKVAKRLFASPVSNQAARTAPEIMALCDEAAREALAALADPDVLAGMAGVLRDAEDEWVRRYADAEGAPPTRSEFQAAAVVEWLRGRAL